MLCSSPGRLLVVLQDRVLDEDRAKLFLRQLLSALEFLHGKRIVQRDIKPSNLLVANDGEGSAGCAGGIDSTTSHSGTSEKIRARGAKHADDVEWCSANQLAVRVVCIGKFPCSLFPEGRFRV